jgi:hypothetical protein
MMLVAFVLAPWTRYMRSLNVVPRSLADDLLVLAIGDGNVQRTIDAYKGTFSFLHCIGAKVSAKKSYTFSSTTAGRATLRGHFWTHINAKVECHTNTRDLGGHLNVGRSMAATTLAGRMQAATAMCSRLVHFPWSREAKQKLIHTMILPKAFYGCEVAKPPEKALAKLSVAIAKCIGWPLDLLE